MVIAELALIAGLFGGMALVFGAQERREERRILEWAEETLHRLAAETRTVEAAAETRFAEAADGDDDAEAPAPPPSRLVGTA